jgi:hypothetical protein
LSIKRKEGGAGYSYFSIIPNEFIICYRKNQKEKKDEFSVFKIIDGHVEESPTCIIKFTTISLRNYSNLIMQMISVVGFNLVAGKIDISNGDIELNEEESMELLDNYVAGLYNGEVENHRANII